MENNIIPSASEYEKLLQEITALQAEIVRLTALRDDLVYRICPSLRAIYEEEIGSLEREILAAQMYLQEKKRILELLRAQLNRQEQMSYDRAAKQAEEEKKAYEEELKRRAKEAEAFRKYWEKHTRWSSYEYEGSGSEEDVGNGSGTGDGSGTGSAGAGSGASGANAGNGSGDGGSGTDGSGSSSGTGGGPDRGGSERDDKKGSIAQRIKRLYRKIVKRLHPDVRPDLSAHEKDLFNQAQHAYEAGDLETLERIWQELEGMEAPEKTFTDTPEDIEKMRSILENLRKLTRELIQEIASIRSEFPYTMRELLENEELLAEKKAELQKQLEAVREANNSLAETIEQLRKELNR